MKIIKPSKEVLNNALIAPDQYASMCKGAIDAPDIFWKVQSQRIDWFTAPKTIKNTSFKGDVSIKWYEDGVLNACYNCIDRHLADKGDKTALIFEANEPGKAEHITFNALHKNICQLANALKELGIEKGDRVIIYMPMIPQAIYAMLACARIGAVHSVVFGGFSPEALAGRITDCGAKLVITADEGLRGPKIVPLKSNTDQAIEKCESEPSVLVYKHTNADTPWNEDCDYDWDTLTSKQSEDCPCEEMNAEDPLFILYTSGSTGKPKGVLHTTGGYMVYTSLTHELVFDVSPDDIYWCTADVGWITGHSYIVYGPLANGTTSVIFEGVPNYPNFGRFWDIVATHRVNSFYTAPTAIRALLKEGDDFVTKHDRSSLRILGTVGEPINQEAWHWYYSIIGEKRCPIVDTWWQTETGGHLLTPLPCHDLKPGAAMKPFFGIQPVLLDKDMNEINGEGEGALCFRDSWPSQMRSIYGDHERFVKTYFSDYPGYYFSGDGARRDKDGDLWITGRMDDVLNVSGHRLGTAEIEDAINLHPDVAESAVIGVPHDVTGEAIYAYVTLQSGAEEEENLKAKLNALLREQIGPIAKIETMQLADALPKTRSGKIMRRVLRKIATGKEDELGDVSTLADPAVVEELIAGRD